MRLTRLLRLLGACKEGLDWIGDRSTKQVWRECPRGDWLLYLARQMGVARELVEPVYAGIKERTGNPDAAAGVAALTGTPLAMELLRIANDLRERISEAHFAELVERKGADYEHRRKQRVAHQRHGRKVRQRKAAT